MVSSRASSAVVLLCLIIVTGCSKNSPTSPTPAPTRANVSITSITVSGARAGEGGFTYRTVVHLRETAGAAATIKSVDLTFMNGSTTLTTSHFDQPVPATGNTTPANGVADTREMVTADGVMSHAFADSVVAKVSYTDSTAADATVSGSAAVPPLDERLPPQTLTLRGIITEQGSDRGIEGARVEATNGANGGKATLTDAAGAYTLTGLVAETFRMRASANGFDSGEQNVTVPDVTKADMALKRTAQAPCAYMITPSGIVDVSFGAGQFAFAITRTSGSCAWQASSNASWLSVGGMSGGSDASLTFSYQSNAAFVPRNGVITVEWSGGSAQLTVRQAGESPAFCRSMTVTVNGQSTLSVPAAGGSYTASITPESGTPPGVCASWSATASSGISLGTTTGPTPGSVTFTVQPNGATTSRALSINISIGSGPSAVLTVSQSGS